MKIAEVMPGIDDAAAYCGLAEIVWFVPLVETDVARLHLNANSPQNGWNMGEVIIGPKGNAFHLGLSPVHIPNADAPTDLERETTRYRCGGHLRKGRTGRGEKEGKQCQLVAKPEKHAESPSENAGRAPRRSSLVSHPKGERSEERR